MKAEILEDIESGRVPASVDSFGDLHDFVDANEYGGFCEDLARASHLYGFDRAVDEPGCVTGATTAYLNACQDAVSQWLAAGRPA